MKNYIFDSSALISFFEGDERARKVIGILKEINDNEYQSYISVINLGEIYYHFLRVSGKTLAEKFQNDISKLNFRVENIDWEISKQAATFKSKHKMSYADTFAAALCKSKNGILITADKEFHLLKNEIKVKFL